MKHIANFLPYSSKENGHLTDWIPRQADNAVFAYQEVEKNGTAAFTVQVYHKNSEDTGEGSSAGVTFSQIGSSDFYEGTGTGLKELIRFRVILSSGSAGDFMMYRLLPPAWFNTTDAHTV